jgi:hypothetical protein
VCNRRGQTPDRSEFFRRVERSFQLLLVSNVADDLGCADDVVLPVLDRRDGEGDIDALSRLGQADRLEVVDSFSGANLGQDAIFFTLQLRRNEQEDR